MLIGHQHQAQLLDLHIRTGTYAHAYLITGPRHVGKMTFARTVAAALLCKKNSTKRQEPLEYCGTCDFCRMVERGIHPDCTVWNTDNEQTSIGVNDIREIRLQASYASHGKARIFLLKDAGRFTREAAHALLKTLEEPRGNTLFFLMARREHDVLGTIRSRVWHIPLWPVSDALLLRQGGEEEVVQLSDGLPGRFVQLQHMSATERTEEKKRRMRVRALLDASCAEKLSYADAVGDTPDVMASWYDESMRILRARIHEGLQAESQANGTLYRAARLYRRLQERQVMFQKPYAAKRLLFEADIL